MSKFKLKAPHLTLKQRESAEARMTELYEGLKSTWPGFIEREGQVTLMRMTLETLLGAKTGEHTPREGNNLAALEAGTGTGKTIAYCLAAIVASEILDKKVVVSTATVTLQEQLFYKDLPKLAEFIPGLTYDLLKGRSRYVCRSRLESHLNGDDQADWWESEEEADGEAPQQDAPKKLEQSSIVWMRDVSEKLAANTWNGDIDSLAEQPQDGDWRLIQADGNACHSVRCAHFKECNFYLARSKSKGARLQIANHALVLSALSSDSTLFDPVETLFVFDEGHHLPEIANEQFSSEIRLGQATKVLTGFRKAMTAAAKLIPVNERPELAGPARLIDECKATCNRFMDFISEGDVVTMDKPIHRFENGVLDTSVADECAGVSVKLKSLMNVGAELRSALGDVDESVPPKEKESRAKAAGEFSSHISRVTSMYELFTAWAAHDKVPLAKWIELQPNSKQFDVKLCASPLTGSSGLSKELWRTVSGAVCTSATLSSCGSFEFFLRLSGLARFKDVVTGVMPSPFDYPKQGQLHIPKMRNDPKSSGFSNELCSLLPELLRGYKHGQLVLFTSRRQMDLCYQALPADIKPLVLVQNSMGRSALLDSHRQRVGAGRPSIVFGLQSLGEGLDLPGKLCEHVVIDKLPFVPPSSPVDEALSEWLTNQNRDAFQEISVPRTSMRLAQWVGRAVRTVNDRARISICDTRLNTKAYGRRILAGLPAFARV